MTVDNDQSDNDLYSIDVDFDINSSSARGDGGGGSRGRSKKNRKLKNPARRNHHSNKKKITPTTSTTTTTTNYNNNNSFNKNSSGSYNNNINGNCSNRSSRSVRFSGDDSINTGRSSSNHRDRDRDRDCYNDDVSSLDFDEYGYDAKSIASNSRFGDDDDDDDDDDDTVSQFFNAPTRRELSTELFKLVEPNGSTSDALSSLSKLRMWGLIADTDQVTTKYLLEYQAVPTLLYFVHDIIDKRRILSMKVKNNNISASNNNSKQMQMYIDEANNNELCLHQAMQVIYHYTCFGDGDSSTNKNSNGKNNNNMATISVVANDCANTTMSGTTNATGINGSSSSSKNVVTQLVETDGIELLITILEEQLRILAQPQCSKNAFLNLLKGNKSPSKATEEQFNILNSTNSTIGQYSYSVSKSVWLILMNVGTCGKAIKLLKTTSNKKKYSHQLKRLVMGIVIGLNYRFYVSGLGIGGDGVNHIMPITQNSSRDTDGNYGSGGESSWMEDLFITLCRLVGSKHAAADSVDNNGRKGKKGNTNKDTTKQNNNTPNNIIQSDDHDEIRSLLIEKWIVKKCLKLLLDEKNNVLGKDSFITTLAMSFFYACVQFSVRYKKLNNPKNCIIAKKNNNNNNNENVENEGGYNNGNTSNSININAEKTVSRSLDYDRLIHFTLKSMKSFPSHQLVQGTGCLILESIPKPYKLLWMNTNRGRTMMVKSSISTTASDSSSNVLFLPHRKTIASAFVKEVVEPCSWYCVVPDT
jgi:hypothetical protein